MQAYNRIPLLGGEGDEAGGAGGEGAADFLAGDGGVVAGEDGVDGAGAEGEVGVDGLRLVAGGAVEEQKPSRVTPMRWVWSKPLNWSLPPPEMRMLRRVMPS